MPTLHEIVGSDLLRRRVERLGPGAHCFGHTHFAWDQTLEGTRYLSWPLGSPQEQATRVPHYYYYCCCYHHHYYYYFYY